MKLAVASLALASVALEGAATTLSDLGPEDLEFLLS